MKNPKGKIKNNKKDHIRTNSGKGKKTSKLISSELSNIIKRSRINEKSKNNEKNLQTLLNSIEDLLFVLDDKGKIIKINSSFIKNLGYTKKELLGMDFILLHPPDLRVEVKKFFGNIITGVENTNLIPLINKNGKIVEVETKISTGKWGKEIITFGICRDISSRKKIEEELKLSEERWKYALEGNCDGVWDLNLKTNQSFHSARWKELLGMKPEEDANSKMDWVSRIHPEDRERTLRAFKDHLDGKTESYICEHRLRCNDGKYKWFLDRGKVLVYDTDCSPLRIVGTIADINERKKTEESLFESDSKNIALLNAIPDFMFLQKKDGMYLDYISPNSKLKTSKQEYFTGKNIRDLLSPDLSDKFLFLFDKAIKTNEVQLLEYEIESDKKKYFEARIVSYGKDDKILTMVRDITDRKLADEALISSEKRYRILAENSKDIICLHKPDSTYEFVSPSIKTLMGYDEEDILGRKLKEFIFDEDKKLIENINFDTSDKFSLQCRFMKKDGNYLWIESIITNIRNRKGEVINLLSVTRDISERKKIEDEITSALIKAKQLNELKSNFISTTSHEFRTPLAAILSSAELIEYYNTEKTKEKKMYHINRIKNSVINMTTMLNDILTINKAESGKISLNPKLTNIKGLFESLIYDLKETDQGKHNICYNFNTEEKEYFLDPKYLSQAVGNLLNNAAKFSPHGGKIELSVDKKDSQLIISISDEGMGIPEKDKEWIFEPFYRGKNVEKISGTGLGLAIAKKTAELHSGGIKVSSNNGKGTIFTLVLPVVKKSEQTG
ncbi:MAG TPA: PAS domain S-box protein [Ignavibacteria bacterium]